MEIASTSSGINVEEISLQRRQVYYKLRSIFPNVSPTYVKNIVINSMELGISTNSSAEELTRELIDHLLYQGDNHIDLASIERSQSYYYELDACPTSEIQYDRLIGIFPDADPEYLQNFAKKYYNQPQKINTFIEDNLLQKKYPTRVEYVRRKNLEKSFRKYFTEFNAKEFLAEFPDPIKRFEQRICTNDKIVLQLLCETFRNTEVDIIATEYKNCRFNASLTAKYLEEQSLEIPIIFSNGSIKNWEKHMPEFSYICNRKKLQQYVEQIRKGDEAALQKSKVKNELLHCEVCFNDFIASKCSTCDNGHIFCNDCISCGTECNIANGIFTIKCFENCDSYFTQKTLHQVLTPKMYNILFTKQLEIELAAANIGNLENCPFCDSKYLVNEEDKIFNCINEDCKKESCRQCKKENHLPFECSDVFEPKKARLYLEEKMTKALVRECHKCKKQFVKLEGCNRMQCNCGAAMCYVCDEPVSAVDYKHFNGQGSSRHDLCPLYSDDKRQEAEAVIAVAKITAQEILKRNPEFNSEIVETLLPMLPPKTAGAHDQVPNSNQLPEHALKVAKSIPP